MTTNANSPYDVFLSHSHDDADTVANIARILKTDHQFTVWLDVWELIPGTPFVQYMAKGLDEARTCAVIVGKSTPKGWFQEEIDKALNKQTMDRSFRVIPVLLPGSSAEFITDFLQLRTWVRFSAAIQEKRPIHELVCGIKGVAPGDLYLSDDPDLPANEIEGKLKQLKKLQAADLLDQSVVIEFQRLLVNEYFKTNK
jgi:hypothetical protein